MSQKHTARRLLAFTGVFVVVYSVCVLGAAITTPDLRIRWLISDPANERLETPGVRFWTIDGLEAKPIRPRDGDILLQLAREPVTSYFDLTEKLFRLHQPKKNEPWQSDSLGVNGDPSEHGNSIPPVVHIADGPTMAEIVCQSSTDRDADGKPRIYTTWLAVHSLPLGEVLPSFVWFVLQLGVLAVAGFAYWNRPFDQSAQLFYALCVISTGAIIGAFHWWIVGGNLWLNLPFIVMAMGLPGVMLHFFLVHPRPRKFLSNWGRGGLALIYGAPVAAILGVLALLWHLHGLNSIPADSRPVAYLFDTLDLLTQFVSGYVIVAGVYFVISLGVLWQSFLNVRNRAERAQLGGMLLAGLLAIAPVLFSIYLARFDRVRFVLGYARIPMFLAVLFFQTAFVIGILRFKMLLAEQFVSRGVLYYLCSTALVLLAACGLAVGGVFALQMRMSLSTFQSIAMVVVLAIAILLVLWLRDRLQQIIDQRFFQEKYQLDKTFQRMNRAFTRIADVQALAEMLFGTFRDVVQVEHLGLLLAAGDSNPRRFVLAASTAGSFVPEKIQVGQEFLDALRRGGMLQRIPSSARHEMSSSQATLRQLNASLVHALENETGIQGLLVLGEKANASPYSAEDMAFLQTMCQLTGVALQSIRVQREMFHLNQEMQMKMERISDQKRQIALLQAELDSLHDSSAPVESPRDDDPAESFSRGQLKGRSPAIQEVLQLVRKVSHSSSSVLIRGESGTGKELLTEVLHDNSPRRNGPLVKVHCAALSPGLLESELFGHVKGAFTGAHEDKIGRFQAAHGGTLFLDEIGDISLETQVKLLRVLQNRSFEPVGSNRTIEVDVRLVAATHQDLERLIHEGGFREDLYYRLNVITLTLPPLRDRPEDIAELAVHFLNRASKKIGRSGIRLGDDALKLLEAYAWPGNIRQLENVIERAAVLADSETVRADDLSKELQLAAPLADGTPTVERSFAPASAYAAIARETRPFAPRPQAASSEVSDVDERDAIFAALEQCAGNKAQAARLLGMPRSTFYSKLQKLQEASR